MATDATGTPTTTLGIPKYNTAADIPSGKGFNAAMDYIDDLIEARGAPPGASGVKVWNNATKTWDTPAGADGTKFLRDDGTFASASGAVEKFFDSTLAATAADFDTGVISLAAYTKVEIHAQLRSSAAGATDDVFVQFNGDNGSNYAWVFHGQGPGAADAEAVPGGGTTHLKLGRIAGNTAPAGRAGQSKIVLMRPAGTTFHKTVLAQAGLQHADAANSNYSSIAEGVWRNTAAITRIRVFPAAGPWLVGCSIVMYGYK